MPKVHPPKGKSRGTMIHAPGGKNHFNPRDQDNRAKLNRTAAPPSKAVPATPGVAKNRKPSDRLWGGG